MHYPSLEVEIIKQGRTLRGVWTKQSIFYKRTHEGFFFSLSRRMERILVDETTGQRYMLDPEPQDVLDGILQYVPALHSHLWDYITVDGQMYSNNPSLIDWDLGVDEWQESIMDQWPFGNKLTEDEMLILEALGCLDLLES